MAIVLGLSFIPFYILMAVIFFSLKERRFYHEAGYKYSDLLEEEREKVRENIKYWEKKKLKYEEHHCSKMISLYHKQLSKIKYWEFSEVKSSLWYGIFWPANLVWMIFGGGVLGLGRFLKSFILGCYGLVVCFFEGIWNTIKSVIIFVNQLVVGDLDSGSEKVGKTSSGGYR